ncbi:MAG: 16S rRNA (guanine(527)-N(7))-methyltransferase RsmG [Bacteroidota bacterium]
MKLIRKYFPDLTPEKDERLSMLFELYDYWNSRINLISRKDFHNLYLHHVLHSLAIAKAFSFSGQDRIVDIGTGGGFPGIPLAIYFEKTGFTLVDSIAKKTTAVEDIAGRLGLKNVKVVCNRAEKMTEKFDFIMSRAVSNLGEFYYNFRHLIKKGNGGIIYLKGGEIESETGGLERKISIHRINSYFKEDYFETKKIVFIGSR